MVGNHVMSGEELEKDGWQPVEHESWVDACASPRATSLRRQLSGFSDHAGFIRDVAAAQPPKHLSHLLRILKTKGGSIISPGAKKGLMPLVIPLAKTSSDAVIALLRWPTAPPGMEMPVVEVHKHGVWLLSKSVDQFIHRILVEEDVRSSSKGNDELFDALASTGDSLYAKGDFEKSQISDLDVFLLKKVGLFPDVLERKVLLYSEKGDHVSALVTGEFYARKGHFPGFARPFVFNAELLLKLVGISPFAMSEGLGVRQKLKMLPEGALRSPWWTLGCKYQDVARIAQWEEEQIDYVKERVSQEGRQEDLNKGKQSAQIALDEAAFLLDLASVEGTWDESLDRIAQCYKKARLYDIGRFLEYRD